MGVSNNEDSGPLVGRSDVGSVNSRPRRVIPDAGKVSEYTPERSENRSGWPSSHMSLVGFHEAKS